MRHANGAIRPDLALLDPEWAAIESAAEEGCRVDQFVRIVGKLRVLKEIQSADGKVGGT